MVYVPHSGGVLNGARAVPKKSSLTSLYGSCGVFSNVVTTCPVTGFKRHLPRELDPHPRNRVFRDDIQRDQRPKRIFVLRRQITSPVNGSGSNGVSTSTVPTFDASGHDTSPGTNNDIPDDGSVPS